MEDTINIDGSYGEGGGSIVRLSMAFASLLKKHLLLTNIRSQRKNPGLRTQHLVGIKLIHQIFGGTLKGAEIGSTEIEYKPVSDFNMNTDKITVKIDTAASIGLIIQSLQIALANLQSELTIELVGGGTYGLWAPSINYIQHVTLPYLKYFGSNFSVQVKKHGFYPKGGARVLLSFKPTKQITLGSINFSIREESPTVKGNVIVSRFLQRSKVAERITKSAEDILQDHGINSLIEPMYVETLSPGAGITLWTEYKFPFGSSFVSQKNISSEKAGQLAATNLINNWKYGGILDEYMADQIIPFMALHSSQIITSTLSNHSKTNIWLCKKFLRTDFTISNVSPDLVSIKTKVQ